MSDNLRILTKSGLTSSKTFNLLELFEGNYFYIPDYQRGYSWDDEQLEDLKKDINNISKLNHLHYTGTIVAAKDPKSENRYEIVDGQQRLTSLIILLNQIYHLAPETYEEIRPQFILRGDLGNEVLVFEPNSETKNCFNEAIVYQREFNASIKSHEAILNAKKFFTNWVQSHDNIKEIYVAVTTKLSFLFFTPNQDKELGIMFEVINNRGKKLSELEKIKNYFIYYATIHDKNKLREDINQYWGIIQTNLSHAGKISNDDENTFLRNCYLVFFDSNKEKRDIYQECKKIFEIKNSQSKYVNSSVKTMREFVVFLASSSKHYAWFYNARYFYSTYNGALKNELDKSITYLRCQPINASIMPIYLAILSRIDSPEKVLKLLELLEKVNMRLYVLPDIFRRADTKQAEMFSYAYEFYNDPNWHSDNEDLITSNNDVPIKGDIFDWLFAQLTQIAKFHCSQERLVDNLQLSNEENADYYRWNGLRYFLACYEEKIKSNQAKRSFDIQRILGGKKAVGDNFNDQLSLEHIWASKNRVEVFPPDYHAKRRLGNFVLCGLSSNITMSNNDIPEKIKELIDNSAVGKGALDMLQVAELKGIYEDVKKEVDMIHKRQGKGYWRSLGDRICDLREAKLIAFAKERWRLPGEKNK